MKWYNKKERIVYNETFAPVERLETICPFLAYATHKGFKIYQMDVKCAFLNGILTDEVYVEQPPSFETEGSHNVYKLKKVLYGLKQALEAWYDTLSL